jgi:hypothetical protein
MNDCGLRSGLPGGGKHWLRLTPIEGPHVQHANVVSFNNQAARKNGLPIIAAITKSSNKNCDDIIIQLYHLVYNASSKHTLLLVFKLREAGVIVNDVHKDIHPHEQGRKGHKHFISMGKSKSHYILSVLL